MQRNGFVNRPGMCYCLPTHVSGTENACGGMKGAVGRYGKQGFRGIGVTSRYRPLAAYAMPGTDIAYAVICLQTPYAMPGTDVAYSAICLRTPYEMPGTHLAYGPSRKGQRGGRGAPGGCWGPLISW
eukprot:1652539-Rhodomonas_salina.1